MKIVLITLLLCLIASKFKEIETIDWGYFNIGSKSTKTELSMKNSTESEITESSVFSNDSISTSAQSLSTESRLTSDKNQTFDSTLIQTVDSISIRKVFTTVSPGILSSPVQEVNQPELTDEVDINGCAVTDSFPELKTLFNNEFMSDYKIITDQNEEIKVHQFVLSLKSSVFAELFQNSYTGELKITHQEYPLYKKLIKFLYTEKITINNRTDFKFIEDIYSLAKKYEIQRLMKVVEERIGELINLDNFKEIFEFAIKQNLTKTIEKWRYFVRDNSKQIYNNKLYASDDQYIWETILFSLNINSTQQLTLLKEKGTGINITRFKRYITIDECDKGELFTLMDLKLFHSEDQEIIKQISDKLDQLCQSSKRIENLHEHIKNQQNDFRNLDSEARVLQRKNQELKRMCQMAPVSRYINQYRTSDQSYSGPVSSSGTTRSRVDSEQDSQRPINQGYHNPQNLELNDIPYERQINQHGARGPSNSDQGRPINQGYY